MAILPLAGCGGHPINSAADWWNDLRGGPLAEQRPPPPGSTDPFPNVSTVPSRPKPADLAEQQRISDQLAAQRDSAMTAAATAPLQPHAPPPAPPAAAPPDPAANKVVVDAAPAPPMPAPPAKAAPAAAPSPQAIPAVASVPQPEAAVAAGALPEFATAPPPLAEGIGDFIKPPDPPPPPPPPTPAVPNGVAVAFTPGSATLPPSASFSLQKFAEGHKGAPIAVTGRGESVLRNADAQSRAMDLAFKRVQAIATALSAAGAPAATLHLHAEAAGIGGAATLLN